ncbi:unnamed protein product [Rotaria sp. Silwood1]|nr:unnamed protein product [Rotaria sp. Silwood1]
MIKEMQPDNTLIAFKDLSTIINKAIYMLPTKVISILQRLYVSYSRIRTVIKAGFTSSSDILSEFVIQSWQVIQHGMDKKDQKALMTVRNQLNTSFIDDLDTFVESSRAELVEIQSQLLLEATGGKVQYLLDKRNELEPDFLQLSVLLKNKSSECGTNQGIIDLLELDALLNNISSAITKNQTIIDTERSVKIKTVPSGFTADYVLTRDKMKLEAAKFKEQMYEYRNKLQKHRDYMLEKTRSASQALQTLPNVHAGNMTRNLWKNHRNWMQRTDSSDGTNETAEYDTNQQITALLEQKTKILDNFTSHMETVKEEMMAVTGKLREQIQDYQNKIQEYRDRQLEERGSFWIFSWKVRGVYAENREKIVRENINRLVQRTSFLQDVFRKGSFLDLAKSLLAGKEALLSYKLKQIQLEQEYKKLKQRYDPVSQKFYAIIDEIDKVYRSTGTVNVQSIKMVDELCRAVQNGHESITSAYAIMRIHLSAIHVDSDLLVASVLDALRVLNMIDSYLGTTKIENIKKNISIGITFMQ